MSEKKDDENEYRNTPDARQEAWVGLAVLTGVIVLLALAVVARVL
jgi:hypothetical protein